MKKIKVPHKKIIHHTKKAAKSTFWFSVGALLGLFFLVSFVYIFYQKQYANRIYPGVTVKGINFSGKTKNDVKTYFAQKNAKVADTPIVFIANDKIATTSAKELDIGFDENLLANQAYSIGRSNDFLADTSIIIQAYINGINLPPAYRYSENALASILQPLAENVYVEPIDARFNFENGRVIEFRPSSEGQELDKKEAQQRLYTKSAAIISMGLTTPQTIEVSVKVLKPKITTEEVNNLGIKELIATGTSLYQGSIESRVYNIALAASRVNGVLVAPDEIFSFNKTLGDVSSFTGYKQAYVIQNGKTVLGDGGGVCQVSTTLFRAALNAGLPIVERHPHAYRVSYYEQESLPGIDATIYTPNIDLKFKNDTGHHILIQNEVDPTTLRLTYYIYGTKDNRQVTVSQPVITSQTPAPPPSYQDDPNLPKGVVKQVDFAASGASVYFTREVVKDGKVTISEKFTTNYRPWQAVFLKGTKE